MATQEHARAASEGVSAPLRALPKPKVQIKSYQLQLFGTVGQYVHVRFVKVLLQILMLGLFTPSAHKRTAEYFSQSPCDCAPALFRVASLNSAICGPYG